MRPQRKRVARRDDMFFFYDQDPQSAISQTENISVKQHALVNNNLTRGFPDKESTSLTHVKVEEDSKASIAVKVEQEWTGAVLIKVENDGVCSIRGATDEESTRLSPAKLLNGNTDRRAGMRPKRKKVARRDDMFCYYDDTLCHLASSHSNEKSTDVRQNSLSGNDIAFTPIEDQYYESSDEWTDDEETTIKPKRKLLCKQLSRQCDKDNDEKQFSKNESVTISEYHCSVCAKSYAHKYHLSRHMRTHHSRITHAPLGRISCDQCDVSLSTKYSWERHVKCVHRREPPAKKQAIESRIDYKVRINNESQSEGERGNQVNQRFTYARISQLWKIPLISAAHVILCKIIKSICEIYTICRNVKQMWFSF